jgi:hypothetical protein
VYAFDPAGPEAEYHACAAKVIQRVNPVWPSTEIDTSISSDLSYCVVVLDYSD